MTGQILAAFVASQSDLVSRVADRVRPIGADIDDVRPYFVYQEIDGQTFGGLDGPGGLATRRLQVTAVASSYGEAKLLCRLLCGTQGDLRLDGFKGTLDGIDVRAARLVDMRDAPESPEHSEQRSSDEIQMDFMITFDEAALPASSAEG